MRNVFTHLFNLSNNFNHFSTGKSRLDSVSILSRCRVLSTLNTSNSTFSVGQCSPHAFPFEAKSQLASSHQSDLRKFAASLAIFLCLGVGNAWGTSYIPGTYKTVTSNETITYSTMSGANATTSGKWIVNPRGGTTSSKGYTNVTSDSNGNPNGLTDNISSTASNVNMPTVQVPSTAQYNQSGKYVLHMRITGITGIIVHGTTGSSSRGVAIYGQEYSNSLTETTAYGSALASMTRSNNSGSFILQYTGFTANKEYLITVAATGGDVNLYAIELIAGAATPTHSVTAATEDEDKGTAAAASATVSEGGTTTITATPKSGYQFDHWTVSGTGASLSSTTTNPTTLTMGTADATVTAYFEESSCPSSGTLYSLTVKSTSYSVPATTETNMVSDYATVTGGGAYIGNKNGSAGKAQVTTTGSGTVYFNGADGYLKLVLDCPIKTGDELSFTNGSGSNQICFTTTNTRNTTYTTESNSYTFPAAFNDVSTIYVWRTSGSSTYLHDLTITRPVSCTAPNHVDVTGTYHFFPGETITLSATAYSSAGTGSPIDAANITGYQWQKYIGSEWTNIAGATSATYTKTNATTSDVGQYRCTISTGATCSTTSALFNVKCLQLYVYWDNNSDKCNLPLTKVDGSNATALVFLENSTYTYHFKITDGCGNWYGNDGTMTSSNCTNWNMDKNSYCGLTTTKAATYTINVNYSNLALPQVSVVYPASDQAASYNLYFANDGRNWAADKIYYRIGRDDHNNKYQMTKVYGTANLYYVTTSAYSNFAAWHIANNGGWSDYNSVYKTKNLGDWTITEATRFEGAPIPSGGWTIIPGSDHSTGATTGEGGSTDNANNNCEFYSFTTVPGMWTHNVSITPPSYGTLTVNYISTSNEALAFSSGNRDLAHTANYCVTAEEGIGYTVASITINGTPVDNRSWHVLTGDVVVAATFTLADYTITHGAASNGTYTIQVADAAAVSTNTTANYGQTITLAATPSEGYELSGWTVTKAGGGTVDVVSNQFSMPADNVTITATFALKTYTVTYNAGTGDGITGSHANDTKTHGVALTLPGVTFTRTGYTQTGWTTSDGGSQAYALSASYTANAAVNLYPVWTAKTTSLTLNPNTANHGTGSNVAVTATFGSALPSFTKATPADGYQLEGYYTTASGEGTKIINANGTLVASTAYADGSSHWNSETASLTLYARYEELEYCYEFTPATSGSAPSNGDVISGTGHGGTMTKLGGTIKYDANGLSFESSSDSKVSVSLSNEMQVGTVITIEMYIGTASSRGFKIANSSGTVKATFSESAIGTYTKTYTVVAGDGLAESKVFQIHRNNNAYLKSVKVHNCGDCSNPVINEGTTKTSFAGGSWTQNSGHTITITATGADSYEWYRNTAATDAGATKLSETSNTLDITEDVATGTYFFKAVAKSGDCSSSTEWNWCGAMTITAAATYSVTYHDHRSVGDPGDGVPETTTTGSVPATANYTAGTTVTVAGNTGSLVFEVEGEAATFRGWNTNANGYSGTFYAAGATFDMPASNVDLYAVWSFAIEYNEDGGTINDDPYATYYIYTDNTDDDAPITATLPTNVTKAGYEFDGWYTVNGAGSKVTGISGQYTGPFAGDYALKAKWNKAADCLTLTHFGKQYQTSDPRRGYAYEGSLSGTKYIIESNNSNNKNVSSDSAIIRLNYDSYIRVLNNGASSDFENVSGISFKWKFHSSSSEYTTTVDVYVGETKVASDVSLTGRSGDSYRTQEITVSPAKTGAVKFVNKGSGSTNYSLYLDDISICSTDACTDPEVTATAATTAVCAGSTLTISASGYVASPTTIQWQKQNGGSWDNISGATSATYTVASATASDAGTYRVVVTKDCSRTSNTVTITIPSAPVFGEVPSSVSVMQTLALSISNVEASDAVSYKWYKSADATFDAGTDTEIGSAKNLIKAYDEESVASPSYYIFCVATNSCGSVTSSAIAVNVTAYIEQDCAIRGNENDAEFGFENTSMSSGTYDSKNVWYKNSNSSYLTYTAPEGKYLKTARVTIASSNSSNASYQYSLDNGANWSSGVTISGLTTSLEEKTINLSAHGNVTDFRIGRNVGSAGESSGTFYLHKACFEYTEACTATTVTPSVSSKTHTFGDSFTKPTFTLAPAAVSGETLTYSSSDEDIATVAADGTVTFQGLAGTVKITASYAGGTISATDYCASEGYYTITVSCSAGAPKIVASGSTNLSGCNASVTLNAKKQDGSSFSGGSYQWYRNGSEIDGATSSSYVATQAGTYTVEYTKDGCTSLSTNSTSVTSTSTQPEVERLVPFQYYHVDKTYTAQMKMRHLFAVKNSGELDGKSFKLYVSRNSGAATDVTSSVAISVITSGDGTVDTVMIDLNKLSGKYSENDELVYTCKAIDCEGNISEVYKATIQMHVIGATPTLALICSGSDKEGGTRKTGELTVGGDFLTGYNKADLCEQTASDAFNKDAEWGLYTRLKVNYIVTPVNGYAIFNKLNYEPFDILLLTDYPKASKSDAAKDVLDDMADLCDYRPMLSFKAHMVAKSPSKWAAKGFTTEPVAVKQGDGRTHLNIVCYAHPMFDGIKDASDHIFKDNSDASQIVYEMLTGPGHESSKGIQGFEIAAAENFVTIGLIHYNASVAEDNPSDGFVTWTPASGDRMLVAAAERQANPEARMVVLAVNCGAQSKFTETGRTIVHKCLQYLLSDYTITPMADCSFTFDNGAGSLHDADWYTNPVNCPGCTGTLGDGKWSTEANWGPDRVSLPGKDTEVKIAAPVQVDITDAVARSARIVEGGSISIPAGKALKVTGTIRRLDGTEISPTQNSDIFIGSTSTGNGTLIFNNDKGDSKATVAMYTTALADVANMSAATSTWQYIGTPHNDVASATYNYYDSWLYQYDTGTQGWVVIPNGGPLVPFRGYCVTHPEANHTFIMGGKLTATTSADIEVPADKYVVAANSWVAPIDINAITDDDMEGITDKSIYFFNTGTDTEGDNTLNGGDRWAAGTYVSSPIHAAPYTGDDHIPSMQGFYVWSTTNGTFHLDYERHVRGTTRGSVVSGPMHAPKYSAESNEPVVAKLHFRGSRYDDRLVVLEREDFTLGYDSGWDGEAWGGSDLSPYSCVATSDRWDAVSAIPEYEGTMVGFRAGEDNEYTIEFEYSEEEAPLYLYDTEAKTYSRVVNGNAYYFTTSDKAYHERFIFTRNAPSIITGFENLNGGDDAKAVKFINHDQMYIFVNGLLYDATGKVVK